MDADTQLAFDAAVIKLKTAGVVFVDVEMPKLMELSGAVGFPLALYEAYDDVVTYLKKTGTGLTIEKMAEQIASPDVKGTYQGLVIPRKLPGPDNTLVDAKPAYEAAMKTSRPALQSLYRDTFAKHRLDASRLPHRAQGVDVSAAVESGSYMIYLPPGGTANLIVRINIGLGTPRGAPKKVVLTVRGVTGWR